jgi:hypothetical protein
MRPAERERLFATAGEFRWLAIADGGHFVREVPKRAAGAVGEAARSARHYGR